MTKQIQQTLIAVAIFLGCAIFVYFKYLITPLEKKHQESIQKLENINRKLAEMKRRAQELPKLQMEMKYLEQEVALLEDLLPKEKGTQDLLRIITKNAQNLGISILNISPTGVSAKPNYNEIPFKVTVNGSYHALALFLSNLGQEPRILSTRNLSIKSYASKDKDDKTITANFELIAYTFKG